MLLVRVRACARGSSNLVQRVAGDVQKALRCVDDGVVRELRVGDHEVGLPILQRFDEGEIGVV